MDKSAKFIRVTLPPGKPKTKTRATEAALVLKSADAISRDESLDQGGP
jgi:hypothetical protein